jgi:hypothetical protein
MICDCQHEGVCQYASPIRSAVSQVIAGGDPEEREAREALTEYVQKYCLRRLPNVNKNAGNGK